MLGLKLMFKIIPLNLRMHIGKSVNQICSLIQFSGIALHTGCSTEIAAEEYILYFQPACKSFAAKIKWIIFPCPYTDAISVYR
jgi:hypothetical protein